MSTVRGFIGAGDVYFNPVDPDTNIATGWVYAGNASKFALKTSADIKDQISKGRDTYGQVIASVALQKPAELMIDFAEVNRDNIQLALMGKKSIINDAAGSVTAEAVTLRTTGGASLAHGNLSATGLVLKNGATTYVKDTDYTVNYRLGILMPVAGSALAAAIAAAGATGLDCTVDYAYLANTGVLVQGSKIAQVKCAVRLDGRNFADGLPAYVEVYEALLTPAGEFDFLRSDWNAISMTGRMNTPLGKTEPFIVRLMDS